MARKASEKTRTGCVTCKKRRVKCDEARPVCKRCHVGDRSCAYLDPPVGWYSWQHLLQATSPPPPPVTLATPISSTTRLAPREVRNLDYFRCVVAPALGGQLGDDFWTSPVLQLAMSEPAAMHGIQAISLLYEGFRPAWERHDSSVIREEEAAALGHYNHALRLVAAASRSSNNSSSKMQDFVVLVASVLFVCIEFLRGNTEAAITHCRHGTLVARSGRSQGRDSGTEAVVAVLQHLGIFPHFFSSGEFPCLSATYKQETRFESSAAAAIAMDQLMACAVRLVRCLDAYRLGADDMEVPEEARLMQQAQLGDFEVWRTAFEALTGAKRDSEADAGADADARRALLLMRFYVGWVWTSIALHREETFCDRFFAEFSEIVKLSKQTTTRVASRPKFTFSMGTAPLLHFVVIKCRHLPTRLEALGGLRELVGVRESLWDAETMYVIGKCIIEHEHGILVDDHTRVTPAMRSGEWELPGDESRIRDSYVEDGVFEHVDERGNMVLRRRIHLIYRKGGAVVDEVGWIS
ncbi:C6 zinc finger domain-containing protein, partial [Microdochium bolleyi]